ncbi:hypothetical protein BKA93DRAFT_79724 [Sparassis latifolia]|uniref:Mediator of RNA polymerase II transcription subunit 25 von Willebrand factor type A domain-containing protein n=1 Tax=Sparassis crispa TaxID=139825 RepID=A0A401H202_9APHY|nr:hypothetical protein SCP_1302530 [Sparassis crispa]GBE88438.1 hypothetical protein SCP_1302530 [Sparassis crispa]
MSDIAAVVCVVDSSYLLASEWPQTLQEYVIPLLQRMSDLSSSRKLLIGYVSYATAETRPIPLLARVFFGSATTLVKDLHEDPIKMGIGQTGTGGSKGMAALEGLVAAVELFDTLRKSVEASACHIVHIAAGAPDSAQKPLWNTSPSMDSVNWNTLPSELQKRKISYSNILLAKLPQLSEFHTAAAVGLSQKPWFVVRPHHALRLTGFPSPQQKGVKRSHEGTPNAERTPEAKRTRVQSHPGRMSSKSAQPAPHRDASPQPDLTHHALVPAPAAAPMPAPPPASASTPASGSPASRSSHSAQVPRITGVSPEQLQVMRDRLVQTRTHLEQRVQLMQEHLNAGRLQEAEALRAQIQKEAQQFNKLKYYVELHVRAAQAASQQPNSQTQHGGNVANSTNTSVPPSISSGNAGLQPAPAAPQMPPSTSFSPDSGPYLNNELPSSNPPVQGVPQPMLSGSQSTQPAHNTNNPVSGQQLPHGMHLPSSVSPQIATQMQKLIEQQRNRAHAQSSIPPTQILPERASVPGVAGPQQSRQIVPDSAHRTLIWRGFESQHEFQTQVVIRVVDHAEHWRSEFWPPILTLTPSEREAVPVEVLQDWLKTQDIVLIQVAPANQIADHEANSNKLGGLQNLLIDKRYAVGMCGGPNGLPKMRLLIFPLRTNTMGPAFAAAYFYQPSGMPETPRPSVCGIRLTKCPVGIARVLAKLLPEQEAQYESLTRDQRLQWIQGLHQRQVQLDHQQQQHRQQQLQLLQQQQQQQFLVQYIQQTQSGQQQPPTLSNMNPALPFFPGGQGQGGGVMNAYANPASQQQPSNPMGMNFTPQTQSLGMSVGMHQRTASGGAPNGVSSEMLQSFMQRNQEGMGGGIGS